jgi:hypothetical protein
MLLSFLQPFSATVYPGQWHRVNEGCTADVSEIHTVSIYKAK